MAFGGCVNVYIFAFVGSEVHIIHPCLNILPFWVARAYMHVITGVPRATLIGVLGCPTRQYQDEAAVSLPTTPDNCHYHIINNWIRTSTFTRKNSYRGAVLQIRRVL